jgi:uncharacterized protein YcfL
MRGVLAGAVLSLVTVTGCSSAEEPVTADEPSAATSTPAEGSQSPVQTPSPSGSPSEAATPDDDDAIRIVIEGDRIEPNGRRVEVSAGEPITLDVQSDRAAELHVHSSPEQMVEIEPGGSTVELTIETPGVVDVEEHDSGIVVLQLEVR